MKKILTLSLLVLGLQVSAADAQLARERLRFQWVGGILMQGNMGTGEMISDFTQFIESGYSERSGGELSVDAAFMGGVEATYRLGDRLTVGASWLHSRARYRLQFPALASDGGNFDFESFLLMSSDWVTQTQGGTRATRAMADAVTDMFLASVTYEVPLFERRLFPYWTLGGGIFRQASDGDVFHFDYEGDPPPFYEILGVLGVSAEETAFGVPVFNIRETNTLIAAGMGVRVSFSNRWSAELRLDDFIRLSPDLSETNVSTPPPDPLEGRIYSVSLRPEEGMIHNVGVRLVLAYSLWPFDGPR